jgi:hypothetical protein
VQYSVEWWLLGDKRRPADVSCMSGERSTMERTRCNQRRQSVGYGDDEVDEIIPPLQSQSDSSSEHARHWIRNKVSLCHEINLTTGYGQHAWWP